MAKNKILRILQRNALKRNYRVDPVKAFQEFYVALQSKVGKFLKTKFSQEKTPLYYSLRKEFAKLAGFI